VIKTANKIIATFFYSGYFPFAPGTFGSLLAFGVWILLPDRIILKSILLLLSILLGIWSADQFSRDIGTNDPSIVVIDEVVGLWLTFYILELFFKPILIWYILGFIFFRLFDIIKPYPISVMEKIDGGLGIMLDDILAGIFAALILIVLNDI